MTIISRTLIAAIVIAYLIVGMLRSIGVYDVIGMEHSIMILGLGSLASFFVFTRQALNITQLLTIATFICLFLYNGLTSRYPGVSLTLCFFLLASSMLFLALVNADQRALENSPSSGNSYPVTDSAKLAFIACATIHALCLVFFYFFEPERTTGLMDDFSQASMLLLLAYGFAYPLLKDKVYFSAFSLLYFIAFFTTFSRTANFLLVLLFIALFVLELKNKQVVRVFKLAALAIGAIIFVYWYPEFLGETAVDRGGLGHFSTLNSRTIYWQTAWEAIQQKPFLGHGLGLFSFTGINEAQPFNIILYVHNDYLQIWHDLGLVWLIAFVATLAYLLLRFSPVALQKTSGVHFSLNTSDSRKFLAWSMLLAVALYMGINFLILNIEFQIAIALLITDLIRK